MTGAAMLWVGWFGFTAGSAGAADTSAGMAMLVTHLSAATASLVWMLVEWKRRASPVLLASLPVRLLDLPQLPLSLLEALVLLEQLSLEPVRESFATTLVESLRKNWEWMIP